MAKAAKPRRRGLRELLRETAGSATAEAVIMIPFFIIVWGCIIFVGQRYEKAIDVAAADRATAWNHVMSNCNGGVASGTEVSDASGWFDMLEAIDGAVSTIIDNLPIVGDFWPGLIPEEKQFVRRGSVEAPEVIGGGSRRVGATIVLMCNEDPKGSFLEEMADFGWDTLVDF